ncbi:hypothetical protein IV49_GL000334 [Kandleria vitulina DSM 20405]|uniref:ABC-type glycine betaine transport system substrate-binding domain-containing protein n=1 Tax=Kandleria vitulina DSM 20405 TaxID=1410657 RepID=A0A0R2HLP4_9FIRM|nr:glycine betaine ABC transporter substrate-binding protein [Kandleria vitulina]KRN50205.1 hypothetical protein IV49_GL000334 [Kandleria vitulina DSM 20405]
MRKISIILLCFCLIGCTSSIKNQHKGNIVIGATSNDDALVAQLLSDQLEKVGYNVERIYGLSSREIINKINNNEINIAINGLENISKELNVSSNASDINSLYELNQKKINKSYKINLNSFTKANRKISFVMVKKNAKKFNVSKLSDLKKVSIKLNVGCDSINLDKFNEICKVYDIRKWDNESIVSYKKRYRKLLENKLDIVLGSSNESPIKTSRYVVLKDDKNLISSNPCVMLSNNEYIKKHNEILKYWNTLRKDITDKKLSELNNKMNSTGLSIEDMSLDYLNKND